MEHNTLEHHRFYLPSGPTGRGDTVRFPENESKHMVSSLRMGKGDVVDATDGKGSVFKVEVEDVSGKRVAGRILDIREEARPRPEIHVFLAVVKGSRMDTVVEKCTELGMSGFVPVLTDRSVGRLSPARLERLRRIAIETMKQSLGSYLPELAGPVSFEDGLKRSRGFDLTLAAWVDEPGRMLSNVEISPGPMKIAVWIGPEGGFTGQEITALIGHGALTYSLGRQRLKTETAAIASVAILRHFA